MLQLYVVEKSPTLITTPSPSVYEEWNGDSEDKLRAAVMLAAVFLPVRSCVSHLQ